MTVVIGLTGSIGMGKSTTAQIFADEGVPVWDADAAVHRIYGQGGAAVAPMSLIFPEAVVGGSVDRTILKAEIAKDATALSVIEKIVHPLVAADRQAFLDANKDAAVVLLDMPLLFETGADKSLDVIIVVSAPADVQAARVLARPGMTREQFDLILSRQMPDAEKRAKADYVIASETLDSVRDNVKTILAKLKAEHPHA